MTVDLEEEACTLALGPYWEGISLRPETRAAIERAPTDPSGIGFRAVVCTLPEARDLLDYFRTGPDALTTIGDARAVVYAHSFDNVRRALQAAGA